MALNFGCSSQTPESTDAMSGRADHTVNRSETNPGDVAIEQDIDRIVTLRVAAAAGDAAARAALGPNLDAREAELWSALRAIREEMAIASLQGAGLVGGDGRPLVTPEILTAHLQSLIDRLATVESASSNIVLPVEMGRINVQIARRERARTLAEMAVVRRLLSQR